MPSASASQRSALPVLSSALLWRKTMEGCVQWRTQCPATWASFRLWISSSSKRNPSYHISPRRDRIMFLKRRARTPLSELAKPDKVLAGIRIDPNSNTRSRMSFYTGISIHLLMDDETLGPKKVVNGYNDNAKINFVGWSPNGQHVAFTVCYEDEVDSGSDLALWVADAESGKAQPLFKSANMILNAVFELYVWVNDSILLVCIVPSSHEDPPTKPLVPFGPRIRSNEQKNIIQMRATQPQKKY